MNGFGVTIEQLRVGVNGCEDKRMDERRYLQGAREEMSESDYWG